jgi:hypothetical protein
VKAQTVFLMVIVNGFVGFYCWRAYQHGMPAPRVILDLVISLVAVNLAVILGSALGQRRRSSLRK